MDQQITNRPKLDVRMQISLSRQHVAKIKKVKPARLSLSGFVRQAVEEKLSRSHDLKDLDAVRALLRMPMQEALPTVEEVNQRLDRRERNLT